MKLHEYHVLEIQCRICEQSIRPCSALHEISSEHIAFTKLMLQRDSQLFSLTWGSNNFQAVTKPRAWYPSIISLHTDPSFCLCAVWPKTWHSQALPCVHVATHHLDVMYCTFTNSSSVQELSICGAKNVLNLFRNVSHKWPKLSYTVCKTCIKIQGS